MLRVSNQPSQAQHQLKQTVQPLEKKVRSLTQLVNNKMRRSLTLLLVPMDNKLVKLPKV